MDHALYKYLIIILLLLDCFRAIKPIGLRAMARDSRPATPPRLQDGTIVSTRLGH